MEGQRLGLEPEPVAEQVESPAEVHVVVEHEEVVVEPAEFLEDVGLDEHGRTRAEEHVLLVIPGAAVLLTRVRLVAHAVPGHGRVEVVDVHAVPVKDLAGYGADVGAGREGVDGFLDPVRMRLRVVVEEGDELTIRVGDTEVAAAREAEVGLGIDDRHARFKLRQTLETVVPGAVLHNDDFEEFRRPVEFLKYANTFDCVVRPSEVHEDNGNQTCSSLLQQFTFAQPVDQCRKSTKPCLRRRLAAPSRDDDWPRTQAVQL